MVESQDGQVPGGTVLAFPKPERMRSPAYLAWVRTLPCCACQATAPSEPHHVRTKAAGGSDWDTVPLCRVCHSEAHLRGLRRFAQQHGLCGRIKRLQAEYAAAQGANDEGAAGVIRARAHHLSVLYNRAQEDCDARG